MTVSCVKRSLFEAMLSSKPLSLASTNLPISNSEMVGNKTNPAVQRIYREVEPCWLDMVASRMLFQTLYDLFIVFNGKFVIPCFLFCRAFVQLLWGKLPSLERKTQPENERTKIEGTSEERGWLWCIMQSQNFLCVQCLQWHFR